MLQDEKKKPQNNTGKHKVEVYMNKFTEIKALATGNVQLKAK